jgi:alkanesulfonate monooxygenase SsuD/methylene tetrahydromethanopterin reductase-like flavin-dependent oxidoreductase (luciferase family)
MRFAIDIAPFDELSEPSLLVEFAVAAEEAGWDGVFLWDHIVGGTGWTPPLAEAWVVLAAIAARTRHIRLGPMVAAVPRRRPWVLARQIATLDRLSGGRLILGVGMGFPPASEYEPFGEPSAAGERAERLDEGLAILAGLLSGQPFAHAGRHYTLRESRFLPVPLQVPRVPVWVATTWPRAGGLDRAARWDGVAPLRMDAQRKPVPFTPAELTEFITAIEARRDHAGRGPGSPPYDVLVYGETGADPDADAARIRGLEGAGATWWAEPVNPWRGDRAALLGRVRSGPPRA